MSDLDNKTPATTEFLLGQILAKVSNTDGNVARLVWRADNIETRVELLEAAEAGRVAAAAKPKSVADKAWLWAVRAAVVAVVGFFCVQLGVV